MKTGATLHSYTTTRPDIVDRVPPRAMRILDVGCSNGSLGEALKRAVPGRIVDGLEFDADFCSQAAHKLDRVLQADLNRFEWSKHLGDTKYDCIIFADVLEHLVLPWQTLKEAVNHLQVGGTAIVSLPNIRHVSALNSIFIHGTFPRISRGIFDDTHLRWFTRRDGMELLRSAGLADIRVSGNLRVNDVPNTPINRQVRKYSRYIEKLPLAREFLSYQYIFEAVREAA